MTPVAIPAPRVEFMRGLIRKKDLLRRAGSIDSLSLAAQAKKNAPGALGARAFNLRTTVRF